MPKSLSHWTVVTSLIFLAGVAVSQDTQSFDVIIRGGTVLDGTGAPGRVTDIGIRGDHISVIGDLTAATARRELNARGFFVSPGFINIHSHALPDAVATAGNMVRQGVTTEIINADGQSDLDIARQLERFSRNGLAENLGAYIGFNSVWQAVIGESDSRPTVDQMDRMRSLILKNLRLGAFGVSGGLDYRPAYFARTAEVADVMRVAGPWRTNFPNHERLTPELGYSSRAGIAETIAIGTAAGIAPEVTHIKAQGHEQGQSGEIIAMMSAATAAGHYTPSDVYPYLAGQTGLADFFIPLWAQEGGEVAMLKRLKNPQLRRRISDEAERAMEARFGGPSGVYLYEDGEDLTVVMKRMSVSAGEAVLRLVEQRPETGAILRFGAEPDLVAFLRNPDTAIACDCGADSALRTHPRYFGAFPRVLGHYVRETGTLSWEDAVRKMTALPAAIIGLTDRGVIAVGMLADIVIFDPQRIIDRATYERPTLAPEGVLDVMVNGREVLSAAKLTGAKPGRALYRRADMPTRRMSSAAATQQISAHASGAAPRHFRVDIDAIMTKNSAVKGALTFQDRSASLQLKNLRIGFVQTSGGWSNAVGVVDVDSNEKVFRLTIDRQDPLEPKHRATLSLEIPGVYDLQREILPGL